MVQEEFAVDVFLRGYKDKDVACLVMPQAPRTLSEAEDSVRARECEYAYIHGNVKDTSVGKPRVRKVAFATDLSEELVDGEPSLSCHQAGRSPGEPPQRVK